MNDSLLVEEDNNCYRNIINFYQNDYGICPIKNQGNKCN